MAFLGQKLRKADDDGPWIVSYADMMTLLCCFFVILYSFSQIDDKKFKEFTKELGQSLNTKKVEKAQELEDMSPDTRQARALHLLVGMLNIGEDVDGVVKKVEANFESIKGLEAAKKALAKDGAKVQGIDMLSDANKISVVMPMDTLFEKGSTRLTAQADKRIAQMAESISCISDLIVVEIEGHTGSNPASKKMGAQNLWAISALQAGVVAEAFLKHGLDRSRIVVRGMADTDPMFPSKDTQGKTGEQNDEKNWRININLKKKKGYEGRP